MKLQMDLWRLTWLGVLAIASGLVGCSAFNEKIAPKLSAEVTPGTAAMTPPPAKYFVEVHPEKGKPQAVERELTEPLHVQTALEQTGVAKKWPRMQVEICRPLPSGGWHKMKLEFDRENHRVPPEFDYALLPGDRIVVTEDTTTIIDDVMERALAPLGIKPPSKKVKAKVAEKYPLRA